MNGHVDTAALERWSQEFERMWVAVRGCFSRRELQRRARDYLRGLLGQLGRKNMWQLAEHMGNATPHGLQRLLDRAVWSADRTRDSLVSYVFESLVSDDDPGVWIVDETGFLKKGTKSAGVQRQYSGTAGRIENCQIGVFLSLATSRGRALIDRELYLPTSWTDDAARCHEAHVPPQRMFATKGQLALQMIRRAMKTGHRPRWVLGDEIYGSDSKIRCFLESKAQPYVLCVKSDFRLFQPDRTRKRIDHIVADQPQEAWFRHSVGQGAKGPRRYNWVAQRVSRPDENGLVKWWLARRSIEKPDEMAYYSCLAPADALATELADAAGARWHIECCFQTAKQQTGLDEYEVRSYHGWYRHITLSMLTLAMLAAMRLHANEEIVKKGATDWSA